MTALQLTSVVALTAVGLALTVPQTWLLLSGRVGAGVSVPGLISSVVSYAAWGVFAVELHDRVFLIALLLPGALEVLTLSLAVRYRGEWSGWWVSLMWAAVVAVAALLGQVVLGVLLAGSIVWEYGPPAWESWRAPSVRGVSVLAWRVRVLDGAVWAGYGLLVLDVQLLVAGATAAILAVVVLVGLRPARRPFGALVARAVDKAASPAA